jgi:hypothetical protein
MPQSHRLSQHSRMASDHKVDAFGIDNQCSLHMMVQNDAVLVCMYIHTSKMMRNIPMSCLGMT